MSSNIATRRCKLCDAKICKEGKVWVDSLSGDEGGTYDFCPDAVKGDDIDSGYGGHRPAPKESSI